MGKFLVVEYTACWHVRGQLGSPRVGFLSSSLELTVLLVAQPEEQSKRKRRKTQGRLLGPEAVLSSGCSALDCLSMVPTKLGDPARTGILRELQERLGVYGALG